jgi:alpha-L-rhamnosidase
MNSRPLFFVLLCGLTLNGFAQPVNEPLASSQYGDPETLFIHPPESAKPGVLWMWMGTNMNKAAITGDLVALKKAGFNRTTVVSLADVVNPWGEIIGKSPTPDMVSFTEPWWQMVRFAAQESRRLGMDFGITNVSGYETSGGPWITPELSMQEICYSSILATGGSHLSVSLAKPLVDPRSHMDFPVFNLATGLTEKPVIPGRENYYKDIAVLAMPADGVVPKDEVVDLTSKMRVDGSLDWDAPAGNWVIYRFGHTTMGALIQPAQPQAIGLECDKMSEEAVSFHLDHIIGDIKKHLGDLIGTGFTHLYFDSYEAGLPTWTPKMREEFLKRRGYDLTPYLATFAGRTINSTDDSIWFRYDFKTTIEDLYRDVYFATISKKLKAANLTFLSEPYGGPWREIEVTPMVHQTMAEFWTGNGAYTTYMTAPTIAALRKAGKNLIEAEAFTGQPADSKWSEYPAWLKPIGDAAFCAGINRIVIHRFTHQPWDEKYKPGNTMGQWGTHFDRTQTWWNEVPALVDYWQRCQALLQWGNFATQSGGFTSENIAEGIQVNNIHRNYGGTDIYFVANTSHNKGAALCSFAITGMQPELWDAVTGTMRLLHDFKQEEDKTIIPLLFDDAQSFFIVFRKKLGTAPAIVKDNFPSTNDLLTIDRPWTITFDSVWGGPAQPVTFTTLQDWTVNEDPGIKFYSGTAIYKTRFDLTRNDNAKLFLYLGTVRHVAHVILNNKDLGTIWTAPWKVQIPPGLLKARDNELVVKVTNVWANRLIGDEQQPPDMEWLPNLYFYNSGSYLKEFPDWFLKNQPRPSKGRYTFTTWNYFDRNSPLVSSGLFGPVRVVSEE